MTYTPTVWQTGDVITAEKLNKIENGIVASGEVTVYFVTIDGSDSYVEVSEAELLNALESGIVVFKDIYEENGEVLGVTDHYVVSVSSGTAYSIFSNYGTATSATWNYNNGRYEGPSY